MFVTVRTWSASTTYDDRYAAYLRAASSPDMFARVARLPPLVPPLHEEDYVVKRQSRHHSGVMAPIPRVRQNLPTVTFTQANGSKGVSKNCAIEFNLSEHGCADMIKKQC